MKKQMMAFIALVLLSVSAQAARYTYSTVITNGETKTYEVELNDNLDGGSLVYNTNVCTFGRGNPQICQTKWMDVNEFTSIKLSEGIFGLVRKEGSILGMIDLRDPVTPQLHYDGQTILLKKVE